MRTGSACAPPRRFITSSAPYTVPSATDFLPSYISAFMKRVITMSPNFASGRISRLTARRRLLMPLSSLRPLGAVQRTALATLGDALRVEHAAQDVIAHARQIL